MHWIAATDECIHVPSYACGPASGQHQLKLETRTACVSLFYLHFAHETTSALTVFVCIIGVKCFNFEVKERNIADT